MAASPTDTTGDAAGALGGSLKRAWLRAIALATRPEAGEAADRHAMTPSPAIPTGRPRPKAR